MSGKYDSKVHLSHSTQYNPEYIWSSYPLEKGQKLAFSEFAFDIPSTILFFLSPVMAVALMKLFTKLGSNLGIDTESEEPVLIPTRYKIFSYRS